MGPIYLANAASAAFVTFNGRMKGSGANGFRLGFGPADAANSASFLVGEAG